MPEEPGVVAPLHAWYAASHRVLPWRDTTDPWRIWVSEIMLQQTRVETVLSYYGRFLEAFPTAAALAGAPLDDALRLWEGMGYYARCRNLHKAAGVVVARFGGRFPDDPVVAATLPGVGRSTAHAILSIAYGLPLAVLDGNVRRVLVRRLDLHGDPRRPEAERLLWAEATRLAEASGDPATHSQAMMELGATVCVPGAPRCGQCPVASSCRGLAAGTAADLPETVARKAAPTRDVAIAIVEADGCVLLRRREGEGLFGGLWELPNAVVADAEDARDAARRAAVDAGAACAGDAIEAGAFRHVFSHFVMAARVFRIRAGEGVREAVTEGTAWVPHDRLGDYALPRPFRKALDLAPR